MNESYSLDLLESILDFTYDSYIEFLDFLKKIYTIIPFGRYKESHSPKLILRHDIDGSLVPAVRMADIEHRHGIHSTFFVLFSGKYNLLEKSNVDRLRRISSIGHEIGLHYDVLQYENYNRPFLETLKSEMAFLSKLINKPVRFIARHNVSFNNTDPFVGYQNPTNAYNDEFYKDARYVSDSCRAWYIQDVFKLLTEKSPTVQLLIHPMLWMNEKIDRYNLLDCFFDEIEEENREYKEYWKSVWLSAQRVQKFDCEIEQFLRSKKK